MMRAWSIGGDDEDVGVILVHAIYVYKYIL